jgi:hypothetical protein
MCPLGAFAFYFHYIYDEKGIIDPMKLDYKVNKSWQQVCSISFDREYISNNRSRSESYVDRSPRQRCLTSKIYTTCIVERMHMPASNHA